MKKLNTRMVVTMGLLIAIEVVLSRFLSFNAWNVKIGFAFVPIALCGMMYGAIPTGIMAVLADLLGATLFPSGMFFPGFTVTALFRGLSSGLLLHEKQTPLRVLILVLFQQFVLGLLVNTLWISILYGSPYIPLMMTRVFQSCILAPVEFVTIMAISKVGKRITVCA